VCKKFNNIDFFNINQKINLDKITNVILKYKFKNIIVDNLDNINLLKNLNKYQKKNQESMGRIPAGLAEQTFRKRRQCAGRLENRS
jgi:hypothetical protein